MDNKNFKTLEVEFEYTVKGTVYYLENESTDSIEEQIDSELRAVFETRPDELMCTLARRKIEVEKNNLKIQEV